MSEKEKPYLLDNLFVGNFDSGIFGVFYMGLDNLEEKYVSLLSTKYDTQKKYERKDLRNLKTLNEYLMEKELDFLLYDIRSPRNKKKFYLSKEEVLSLLKTVELNKARNKDEIQTIRKTSEEATKIICDLIGLNANDYPATILKFQDRVDVVVPAVNKVRFQRMLEKLISVGLLENEVFILENGYDGLSDQIEFSLMSAGIISNRLNRVYDNFFEIEITKNGVKSYSTSKRRRNNEETAKIITF